MTTLRPTFCGLSVSDYKSGIGWAGGGASTLAVSLVEDESNGDLADPPPLGSPVHFRHAGFVFGGLLQKWSKRRSPSLDPGYDVLCLDPREILEGTQLLLGSYYGSVSAVKNLLNVFGWHENNFGFGASLANDTGMPWSKVAQAVTAMTQTAAGTPYGGPLMFQGYSYAVDLGQLPTPDVGYRLGGTTASLMEAISLICEDGGYDYFVDLVGLTIRVRTVSRRTQPPLGTIAALAETNFGNVARSEDGLEIRNETTSAFLGGSDVCTLFQTDNTSSASFWGYDTLGNPILGETLLLGIYDRAVPPNLLGTVETETMDLNATGVADVLGGTTYNCTTLEMRLAMVNYDSWAAYIKAHRPDIAAFITSPFFDNFASLPGFAPPRKPDLVNDAPAAAVRLDAIGQAAVNSDFIPKYMRLYEFVKAYGTEFLGRKFLVGIPFVLVKQDPETLKYSFASEPTDGGWQPEGSSPLGLPALKEDVFRIPDGRFRAFVAFADVAGADLARVSPADTVIEGGTLYVKAEVNRQILFLPATGQPAVLVTLGSAVYDEAVDAFGGLGLAMIAGLGRDPREAPKAMDGGWGNVGIKVWPDARYPDAFAIPLKSNTTVYGPWFAAGAPGKVRVEIDNSLNPWSYGGWDQMNAAANAKVLNAVTSMQVSESGLIELAEEPRCSLGDTLSSLGPNVTAIDVNYGRDGFTTSYRMQTYSPRFGVFSKGAVERIKRLGLTAVEVRKALRSQANSSAASADAADNAVRGFMANAPKAINRQSPHETLVAHVDSEADASGNLIYRVCPKTSTFEESVGLARGADPSGFRRTAVMSLDGLLRPFTTRPGGGDGMPGFATPSNYGGMNSYGMNPFAAGNDLSFLTSGDEYAGLNAFRRGNDPANSRGVALRGPVVISGWGYGLDGSPVPGDGSGGFLARTLRRSDAWKVGPLDPLWDEKRGVWTVHDALIGTTTGSISPGGSGTMSVDGNGGTMTVFNCYDSAVPASKVVANYVAPLNRWYVVTQGASSSSPISVDGNPSNGTIVPSAYGTYGPYTSVPAAGTYLVLCSLVLQNQSTGGIAIHGKIVDGSGGLLCADLLLAARTFTTFDVITIGVQTTVVVSGATDIHLLLCDSTGGSANRSAVWWGSGTYPGGLAAIKI